MAVTDDIKARVDIVDVVEDFVPDLKRTGKNYHARCPFHQENTPSFVVFPDRQSWRCFGACATGGDVFSFVMKIENSEFPAALRSLAARAGIVLPDRAPAVGGPSNPLVEVNETALRFFRDSLLADKGSLARAYVEQRELSEETIVRFGIGYAPSTGDDLLKRMRALGFSEEQLIAAGVVIRNDGGRVRDMFRGRLMFALRDAEGRPVGFAGRSLDGSNPKYINTPQTAIFDKGSMLYGMDRARESISQEGVAVVVEGYMDVIAAHEHGYRNVVASMGTALTEQQTAMLRARAQRIVLALDADAAGQEAMLRSLGTAFHLEGGEVESGRRPMGQGVRLRAGDLDAVRVALIVDGKDPDELIRLDPSRWSRLIAEAVPVVDFLLRAEAQRLDLSTTEGKALAVERLMPMIYGILNWADQDRYFKRLADLLGVPVSTLEASVGRTRRLPGVAQRRPAPRSDRSTVESVLRQAGVDPLDEYALALLTHYPDLFERAAELSVTYLNRPENRAVLSAIQGAGTLEGVYPLLDASVTEHLLRITERVLPVADRRQRLADWEACLRRLEERYLRELKAQEEVALGGDPEGPRDAAYLDAVNQQALITNQRLKELFVGSAEAPR